MKNKLNHKIGVLFQKLSRWFFDRTLMACWHCGALVGMNSTIAEGHMWCEPCFQRYIAPRRYAAEHSVQRTVEACPDDRHMYYTAFLNYEFCPYCGQRLHSR